MRIAINTLPILVGGAQTYTVNLVRHLARKDPRNRYLILCTQSKADLYRTGAENFEMHLCPTSRMQPYWRIIWEQARVPALLDRWKADLLLCPGNTDIIRSPLARSRRAFRLRGRPPKVFSNRGTLTLSILIQERTYRDGENTEPDAVPGVRREANACPRPVSTDGLRRPAAVWMARAR